MMQKSQDIACANTVGFRHFLSYRIVRNDIRTSVDIFNPVFSTATESVGQGLD